MTWVRLSDTTAERPVWDEIGAEGFALHVSALCYSARNGVEGRLSRLAVRRLPGGVADPIAVAELLAEARVWRRDGEAFVIVEDLADQITAREMQSQREWNADRQRRLRKHKRADHSECTERTCAVVREDPGQGQSHDVARLSHRESRDPDQTRPDQTRPEGSESGEVEDDGAGFAAPVLVAMPESIRAARQRDRDQQRADRAAARENEERERARQLAALDALAAASPEATTGEPA